MTGAEAFGVTPDIMNVAKQLTNGAVPMGAVIASCENFDTFMHAGGPQHAIEFSHGYTYSGHPVACAASLAALDLLVREDFPAQVRAIAPVFENKTPTGMSLPAAHAALRPVQIPGNPPSPVAPATPARATPFNKSRRFITKPSSAMLL
jgi:adenosylmethionine-8-amino-7-oxononanoate aminotransferase